MGPSWGTSCFLSMVLIWSSVWMDGDKPPCTQKIYKQRSVLIKVVVLTTPPKTETILCFQHDWHEEIPVTYLTLPSMIAERDK